MRVRSGPAVLFLVVSLFGAPASPALTEEADATPVVHLVRVYLTDPARDLSLLSRLAFDVAGVDVKAGVADVLGGPDTLPLLRSLGFQAEFGSDLTPSPDSLAALSDYLTPDEIVARIDALVAAHPALALKSQYAQTVEGRPLWALKISDTVAAEEDEPTILFVAQHHAREVMTPEIGLDIAEWLLGNYGSDPRATAWVDGREIWVLPNHNPDGANHVFTINSNWRKNRRVNGDGTFGVDQNRNYAFRWGSCSGSSGSPGDDTYRGPSPASEPETYGGITELARAQRPTINLSYHTYGELVIMPYGCSGSFTPENRMFRDLSSTMAVTLVGDGGANRYQPGTAPELLYAVDGEMNDWFYGELGSYGVTVEANTSSQGFQPDYATWRTSTVVRNRPGWQYLLDRLDGPGIVTHVTDACTGLPLPAGLSLDEVVYAAGEAPRTAEPGFGRFHWLTLPGTYHLRATHPGYAPQVWPVEVGYGPVGRAVRLVPAGSHALAAGVAEVGDAAGDADGQADPGETVDLAIPATATGEAVTGATALLDSSDPYVTILDGEASLGAIPAGGSAAGDGFRIAVAANAPDGHVAALAVSFAAAEPLCAAAETVSLRITSGAPSCPFVQETLDADPGWLIDNTGTGGWAYGAPQPGIGPGGAYTGTAVYGTNLAGNYGPDGDFRLATTPFDLRGLRRAELRYARWLRNEAGYDLASVEMSLDGGASWSEIWSGFDWGGGWFVQRIPLPPEADQEEDVRFRFRLRSDGSTQAAGFYVDDVAVCGEAVPTAGGKLKHESHTVDDAGADAGNGNGALDPGETVTLAVRLRSNLSSAATGVDVFLSTSTPGVRIRNGHASYPDIPAGGIGDSLAPHFSVTVDDAPCAAAVAFTLDARWAGGGRSTSTFSIPIGTETTTVVLDDTFESDQGWTAGGTAAAGHWVRQDPNAVTDASGAAVQPGDDTTPAPGVLAWITANPSVGGNFNPLNGDVDRGMVWLQSPVFDGAAASRVTLDLRRWFVRRNPVSFDASEYRLLASSDGGASWIPLERSDADLPAWATLSFELLSSVPASASMRIRVEVEERKEFGLPGDTLLECLVDDVKVTRVRPECSPFSPPARLAPHGIGDTLRLDRDGDHLALAWTAPPADAGHDPASGYRVYRSGSPAVGFAQVSAPTATGDTRPDELLSGEDAYWLVAAENAGGVSADAP